MQNENTLNTEQEVARRSILDNRHNLIMGPRQCGLTTLLVSHMMNECFFGDEPNQYVYIVDSDKMCKHVMEICSTWLDEMPYGIVSKMLRSKRADRIEFANGSFIKIAYESQIVLDQALRGHSLNRCIIDNANFDQLLFIS